MSRFKVGDKVRYISGDSQWNDSDNEVAYGMEGIVSGINDDGEVEVSFVCRFCDYIDPENLELVAPTDKKREFLERLQSLMRDYDVHINSYFDQSDEINTMTLVIGTETVCYSYTDNLTADNIMDFDKE